MQEESELVPYLGIMRGRGAPPVRGVRDGGKFCLLLRYGLTCDYATF
jgi:hypothetical protein